MKRSFDNALTTVVLLFTVSSPGLLCQPAAGQSHVFTNRVASWIANGAIHQALETNGVTIVAGEFTRLGRSAGSLVAFDQQTAEPATGWPRLDGAISAIEPDGSGGCFVGGYFNRAGGHKSNLLHVRAGGQIDAAALPEISEAHVSALCKDGDRLYVGLSYFPPTSTNSGNVLAIDLRTRTVLWKSTVLGTLPLEPEGARPPPRILNPVNLRVTSLGVWGGKLYFGGGFQSIGGQMIRAQIPPSHPSIGRTNYTGGLPAHAELTQWRQAGGVARPGIAALDAETGRLLDWCPPGVADFVNTLAVNGSGVFVGGVLSFRPPDRAAGPGFYGPGLALLDHETAQPSQLLPSAGPMRWVNTLAQHRDRLFIGGQLQFTPLVPHSNIPRNPGSPSSDFRRETLASNVLNHFAALDLTDGSVDWDGLRLNSDNRPFSDLRFLTVSQDRLYLLGLFDAVNQAPRNGLAAFDLNTEQITPWNPRLIGSPRVLAGIGQYLLVGGVHLGVDVVERRGLAAIDTATGRLLDWDPSPDGMVTGLALVDDKLELRGNFTRTGDQIWNGMALIPFPAGARAPLVRLTTLVSLNQRTVFIEVRDTNVSGTAGRVGSSESSYSEVILEASTDLVTWIPIATNATPFVIQDVDAGKYAYRFYRTRSKSGR